MKKIFSLLLCFLILFTCGCKRNTYTATFKDSDGSILKELEIPVGQAPSYGGTPDKESDDIYDYKFYSWDKELAPTNEDTTYTAIYTTSIKKAEDETIYNPDLVLNNLKGNVNNDLLDNNLTTNSYFVTFLDDDNTILQKTKFNYGSTPYYSGGSPITKIIGDYIYTFTGWDKKFSVVKGEQTYVARYNATKIQNSSQDQTSQNQNSYVTPTADNELSYNVVLIAYDLSNNQNGGGTFIGAGSYKANSIANIQAIPNKGMHFVRWNDGSTNPSKSITVTNNVTCTAYFEKDTPTSKNSFLVMVLANDSSGGTVSITPKRSDGMYEENTSVTISATPKTGYTFTGWKDNNDNSFGDASQFTKTFTVTKDGIYTAIFTKDNPIQPTEDDDIKSNIKVSLSNINAGYIKIDGVQRYSYDTKVGDDVEIEAVITSAGASFEGWSYTNNKNNIFSKANPITIKSKSSTITLTGFVNTSGSDPVDDPSGDDDPSSTTITTPSIISNPDGACSFTVNGGSIPTSLIVNQKYIISFYQTIDQSNKYVFSHWDVGGENYSNTDLELVAGFFNPNQIVAHFNLNPNYDGEGTNTGDPININDIKIGDVITFNNSDDRYLVFDLYTENSKTIGKVIPLGTNLKTIYSSLNLSSSTLSDDTKIIKACSSYTNSISNPVLKQHLYTSNIIFYDYLNASSDNSYSVHKSTISNTTVPSSLKGLSLSCYPLGLDDFDKFYSFKNNKGTYKGIYSSKDLENFLSLTTGSKDSSVWFKDLVSSGSSTINTGIYISKDGISTNSLSFEKSLLPVVVVELDQALNTKKVSDQSLVKANKYTITFSVNNSEYGHIDVSNKSYSNIFAEGETIKVKFINKNPQLYELYNWNDDNNNNSLERNIAANKNFDYIANAGYIKTFFEKDYDILPFITSVGQSYINTGYIPKSSTKIIIQYEPLKTDSNTLQAIFGVSDNTNKFELYTSNSKTNNAYNTKYIFNSNTNVGKDIVRTQDYEQITATAKGLDIKGLQSSKQSYSFNSNTYNGSLNSLYLFASNVNGNANGLSKIKLYSCQIYEGDTLVRNFIPTKKRSAIANSQFGLYDTVNSVYYPSSNPSSGFVQYNDQFSNSKLIFNKYSSLDYIQNNGESYIDTGVEALSNVGLNIEFTPLSRSTASYIGTVDGDSKLTVGTVASIATSDSFTLNASYLDNNGTQSISLNNNYSNVKTYVSYNLFNGGNIYCSSNYKEIKNIKDINKNIYIGTANGDANIGPFRIYSAAITSDNVVSHYYLPVKDGDIYGLLDIYGEKFYDLTNTSFSTPKANDNLSKYTILQRIISDGDQYINTGSTLDDTTGIKASFIPLEFYDAYYIGSKNNDNKVSAIGADLSSSKVFYHAYRSSPSSSTTINAPSSNSYVIKTGQAEPVTVKYNYLADNSFKSSNTTNSSTPSSDYLEIGGNILIGHVVDEPLHKAPAIYYNVSISKDSNIEKYFVPAKNGSTIGFLDVVNNVFYSSQAKVSSVTKHFYDGSFPDNTTTCRVLCYTNKCENLDYEETVYNGNTKLKDVEYQKLKDDPHYNRPFLSTINYQVFTKDDALIGCLIDSWENGLTDDSRNVIAYLDYITSKDSQKYSFSERIDNSHTIKVNFQDQFGNTYSDNEIASFTISNSVNENGKFYPKENVTITITPNDGYIFKYWDDNHNNTNPERKIIINEDDDNNIYTAFIEIPSREVTISISEDSSQYSLCKAEVCYKDAITSSELTKIITSNNNDGFTIQIAPNSDVKIGAYNFQSPTVTCTGKDKIDKKNDDSTNKVWFTLKDIVEKSVISIKFGSNCLSKGDVIKLANFPEKQSFRWQNGYGYDPKQVNDLKNNFFKIVKIEKSNVVLMDIGTICSIMPVYSSDWNPIRDSYSNIKREKSKLRTWYPRGTHNVIDTLANYHMKNYYNSLDSKFTKYIVPQTISIDTYDITKLKDSYTYQSIKSTSTKTATNGIYYLSLNDVFEYIGKKDSDFKVKKTSLSYQFTDDQKEQIFDLFGCSNELWAFEEGYTMPNFVSFALRDKIYAESDGSNYTMHKYYDNRNFAVERIDKGKCSYATVSNTEPRNAIFNYIRFCFTYDLTNYFNDGYDITKISKFSSYKDFSKNEINGFPKLTDVDS